MTHTGTSVPSLHETQRSRIHLQFSAAAFISQGSLRYRRVHSSAARRDSSDRPGRTPVSGVPKPPFISTTYQVVPLATRERCVVGDCRDAIEQVLQRDNARAEALRARAVEV